MSELDPFRCAWCPSEALMSAGRWGASFDQDEVHELSACPRHLDELDAVMASPEPLTRPTIDVLSLFKSTHRPGSRMPDGKAAGPDQ